MKDIKNIQKQFEKIFEELGFQKEMGQRKPYWKYGGNCCWVTYLDFLNAFVTECADNEEEAFKGIAEDTELYYLEDGVEKQLKQFREDVKKYYMD